MPKPINSRTINWYRTKLSPEQLRQINLRSDFKGFIQAGGFLSILVITGCSSFASWYYGYWGLLFISLFCHATVCHFSINAIHELVHGTVFETQWLNRAFATIFSLISSIDHDRFWASHTEHHKYTLFYPDDGEVVAPVTIDRKFTGFIKTAFINIYFFKSVYNLLKMNIKFARGHFPKDPWLQKIFPETYPEGREAFFKAKKIQVTYYAAVIIITLLTGYWVLPLIFLFSNQLGGSWLHVLCNQTQHTGLKADVPDFRINCRTIYLHRFVRFLYWQMNYHVEHHMFAAVPCYNLKKCHELIKHECAKPNDGLLETWLDMIAIQEKMEEDKEYRYIPVLPSNAPGVFEEKTIETNNTFDVNGVISSSGDQNSTSEIPFKIWECSICGFIYDEVIGLVQEGIKPGTRWEDIPNDWSCPDCGIAKSKFKMIEVAA